MEESDNQDLTDQQIDDLVGESEKPSESNDRQMSDPPAAKETTQAPQGQTPKEELLEFVHNGKKVQATRDQVLKWAQQGYDYPQKAHQLNQERSTWDQQRQAWEQSWGRYKQIDEWASKNPDAWKAIESQYQARQIPTGVDPSNPLYQELQAMKAQLGQVGQFIQGTVSERQAAQTQQEDQALDQEIKSIREQYQDLDFDRTDESGKSLEFQVLEHAQKNGIGSFKTAFRDFYHDQLMSRAQSEAKQNLSKEVQKKTRLGVLGESPTPRKGLTEVQDVKKKSYNDLEREALEELGIA